MTSSLMVVGSVAFDTVETRAGKRKDILGGAATYIALAATRFCKVNMVAVVGDDFPQEHVDMLVSRGVDVTGLDRKPGRTFRWSGIYAEDFSSRTTLDTQLGVFESFNPEIPKKYLDSSMVLLGNIHPALQLQVLDAIPKETFVAADTMNLWIDITREALDKMIKRVDLLMINDEESFQLTGERQITLAAKKLLQGRLKALIIKRGEHGAYLFTKDSLFFAPALPLTEVIDPTGAGDTFAGGLMGYLVKEGNTDIATIKRGMVYGAALASSTVQGFGPDNLAAVTESELTARYDAIRNLVAI